MILCDLPEEIQKCSPFVIAYFETTIYTNFNELK